VPGCSSALMSKTLSSKAVVGRMVSSIHRRTRKPRVERRAAYLAKIDQAAFASI
jgi:hypothetical protein